MKDEPYYMLTEVSKQGLRYILTT